MSRLPAPSSKSTRTRIDPFPWAWCGFSAALRWFACLPAVSPWAWKGGRPISSRPGRCYLSAFYIDRYEATNARYFRFWAAPDGGNRQRHTPASHGARNGIGDWPERVETGPNFPVVGISWFDAAAYCAWRGARLPTEAEWEKTARGDEAREPYPWNKGLNGSRANYRDGDDGYDNTLAPVGNYPEGVSFYGAMDLVGNVWEWCADYYDSEYYKVSATHRPHGTGAGRVSCTSWRVLAHRCGAGSEQTQHHLPELVGSQRAPPMDGASGARET